MSGPFRQKIPAKPLRSEVQKSRCEGCDEPLAAASMDGLCRTCRRGLDTHARGGDPWTLALRGGG